MSNIIIAKPDTKKQEALTCCLCGHTGTDVKLMDYQEYSFQSRPTVRELCLDSKACSDRQLQRMTDIDKELDLRAESSEFMAECRRNLAVED